MLQSINDFLSDLSLADWLKFGGCIVGLLLLGLIQFIAAVRLGFASKKLQIIHAVVFVSLVGLAFWKGVYLPFQIGLPIVLAIGLWYAYYMVGGDYEQTVERHLPALPIEPIEPHPPSGPMLPGDDATPQVRAGSAALRSSMRGDAVPCYADGSHAIGQHIDCRV